MRAFLFLSSSHPVAGKELAGLGVSGGVGQLRVHETGSRAEALWGAPVDVLPVISVLALSGAPLPRGGRLPRIVRRVDVRDDKRPQGVDLDHCLPLRLGEMAQLGRHE